MDVTPAHIRYLDPQTLVAFSAPFFFPVVMVCVDWPGGAVRAHSGAGAMAWGGDIWHGVGRFGEVVLPEEAGGLASMPARVRLVGLPDDLDMYLDLPLRGRRSWIGFGAVTERAGNVLRGAPVEAWAGYVDALRDVLESEGAVVSRGVEITLASGPSQRAHAEVAHTFEDQIRHYPGDTAGRWVINAEARAQTRTWPE